MSKLYGLLFFLLVADYASSKHAFVYEFGQNTGDVMYQYDGTIPLFQPVTKKDIIMPPETTTTYVRVTVYALSPPKVDYEADTKRVTIKYDWTQISYSTYSILAKGIRYDVVNIFVKINYQRFTTTLIIFTMDYVSIQTLLFSFSITKINSLEKLFPKILYYEYGKRVPGDTLSYVYTGEVPAYQPHFNLSVKLPLIFDYLGSNKQFTYLRVHYSNPMSKVNVSYNPQTSMLQFFVKYPFMTFPFGIEAYSSIDLFGGSKTFKKIAY